MHCNLVKAKTGLKTAAATAKAAVGDPAPTEFTLFVDESGKNFTVLGKNAGGHDVDISGVAALAVASDAPAVVTVGAPSGMTFSVAAGSPAPTVGSKANVTITATWNDGSIGPFTITVGMTIIADPVTGIAVQPSTPTIA